MTIELEEVPQHIQIVCAIIETYKRRPNKWRDATLGGIKDLTNTYVGNIGQDFVQEWCEHLKLDWQVPDKSQSAWDIRIEGFRFEIKTATEDINGNFQFNHIRLHRDYDGLICLGIGPEYVKFDCWRKGSVAEKEAGTLVTMDRGSSATWKLTKRMSDLRDISEFEDRIKSVIQQSNA